MSEQATSPTVIEASDTQFWVLVTDAQAIALVAGRVPEPIVEMIRMMLEPTEIALRRNAAKPVTRSRAIRLGEHA